MKQIPGQMSLFDIIKPQNDENLQKTALKCGSCAQMCHVVYGLGEIYHGTACHREAPFARHVALDDPACDQYEPKGDCKTCRYRVWLHFNDGTTDQGCAYNSGCKWEKEEEDAYD